MSSRHLILLFLLASLSRLPAEPEPEKPVQNVAVTLFGSLLPGLKITRLGTAEPAPDGGTRFRGKNEFEFTTKSGDTIHAESGAVTIEPAKSLVTLSEMPSVRMKSHSLIATADETRITYRTDTGKITASGPHRIAIGGIGKKSP